MADRSLRVHELPVLPLEAHRRVLILAPHPDDEALACGGLIARALQARPAAEVHVIVATDGEASLSTALIGGYLFRGRAGFRRLAAERRQESQRAALALGLSAGQLEFWGFPDRGLEPMARRHWEARYRSWATGQSATSANGGGCPHTGAALLARLRSALSAFRPEAVFLPHPADAHADHRALAGVVMRALALAAADGFTPDAYGYPMWLHFFPRAVSVKLDRETLQLPPRLATGAPGWTRLPLAPDVRRAKARALRAYRSQARVMPALFRHADGACELFARLQPEKGDRP